MDRTLVPSIQRRKRCQNESWHCTAAENQRRAVMFSLWIKSIDVYVMMTVDVVQLAMEREGRSRWERNGRTAIKTTWCLIIKISKKSPVDILRHLSPNNNKKYAPTLLFVWAVLFNYFQQSQHPVFLINTSERRIM
jgi:hypothetical protein